MLAFRMWSNNGSDQRGCGAIDQVLGDHLGQAFAECGQYGWGPELAGCSSLGCGRQVLPEGRQNQVAVGCVRRVFDHDAAGCEVRLGADNPRQAQELVS